MELRSPRDVVNLGVALGLPYDIACESCYSNVEAVISRAQRARNGGLDVGTVSGISAKQCVRRAQVPSMIQQARSDDDGERKRKRKR